MIGVVVKSNIFKESDSWADSLQSSLPEVAAKESPEKTSKNFAIILSKLEKLNPAELEKQMEVFQKSMMETRMTYAIRRVQRSSLILTALATITVFVLLLNFVVVVVFLNTIETLNQLFV